MVKTEQAPEFFQSVVKYGSDLITIVNRDGLYTYLSDSVTRVLGYSVEETIGKSPFSDIHEDDLGMVLSYFQTIFETDNLKLPYFRYKHKNGTWRWLECTADNMISNKYINGIVTNSRDVTEKVEAEQRREENKAYYKALYFNHPDLVFTLTKLGFVKDFNANVPQVTGYNAEEVLNQHFTSFIQEDYLATTLAGFKKAMEGQAHVLHTKIITKQKDAIDLNVTLVPVYLHGGVEAIQCVAIDITEKLQAEQQLQNRATQLNNILGSITEPFLALDENFCITYVNAAFKDYLKIDDTALYGQNIWEKFPMIQRTHFYEKCIEVSNTGEATESEEYLDAISTVFYWKIYPFESGIAICFTDISAKQKTLEEQENISLVASKTTNGVLITDSLGQIEWVNRSFEALTGYRLLDVLGKDPSEFLYGPATQSETVENIRENISKNIPFSAEMINYTKSGEQIWVALDVTPILDEQGQLTKLINIYTDITSRKEAELKLLQLSDNLFKQNRDLQQFTYIVSHNLRAPVANVVGLTKMLRKLEIGSPQYTAALANLDKSAIGLDNVIKDLNKIVSVKSDGQGGVLPSETETVDLEELVLEVVQSLQEMLTTANANIKLSLEPRLFLDTKRAYLYSIIHNLLTNAIKYRSPERDLLILLESVKEDNIIRIKVKDNGSGMDMNRVKPHLFMLYKRFHSNIEGRGLGLYLVKSQVEALDGIIEVDSELGSGTEFKILFKSSTYD